MVQYVYDAWGNHAVLDANGNDITSSTHIGNLNPYRYRGYYYDTETGLYYLQTRYYDPEICRFMTIDDIEYIDIEDPLHGRNLYAYCANNPVMNVDPTGHSAIAFGVLVALGVLATTAIGAEVSIFSQGLAYGWDNINGWQVLVDGLFAGVSALLASTPIGLPVSILLGGIFGELQYVIDSAFHPDDTEITWHGALLSFGLGMISGLISRAGAKNAGALAKSVFKSNSGIAQINFIKTLLSKGGQALFEYTACSFMNSVFAISFSTWFNMEIFRLIEYWTK